MQFTRFSGRCTTGSTRHGVYLLHGEFFGFHSAFVFLLGAGLNRTVVMSDGSTTIKKAAECVTSRYFDS